MTDDDSLCTALGGEPGVLRLAEAWHRRAVADDVVGHAFSHGFHPQHTQRLAAYWVEALGGPPAWTGQYGSQADVLRAHAGNGEHTEMDERAVACFDAALDDVGVPAPLRDALHAWFAWATTVDMAAYPGSPADVPEGRPVPVWTWTGLRRPV